MGDRHPDARVIRRMARQEERHREILDKLLAERGVRPTAMQPLWDVAGFALGAATALMGPRAAMACTAAVETEIERHYHEQLDPIGDHDRSEEHPSELQSLTRPPYAVFCLKKNTTNLQHI